MENDREQKRSLDMAFDRITGRSVRKPTQGIRKQLIESHFFRAGNGDPVDGGPSMPMIRISEAGGITILGALEEWWGSVYDPILHAEGYLLRVVASRRWRYPWRIDQATIIPLSLAVSEAA